MARTSLQHCPPVQLAHAGTGPRTIRIYLHTAYHTRSRIGKEVSPRACRGTGTRVLVYRCVGPLNRTYEYCSYIRNTWTNVCEYKRVWGNVRVKGRTRVSTVVNSTTATQPHDRPDRYSKSELAGGTRGRRKGKEQGRKRIGKRGSRHEPNCNQHPTRLDQHLVGSFSFPLSSSSF